MFRSLFAPAEEPGEEALRLLFLGLLLLLLRLLLFLLLSGLISCGRSLRVRRQAYGTGRERGEG